MKKQNIVQNILLLTILFFCLYAILNFNSINYYTPYIQTSFDQNLKTSSSSWINPVVISDNQNGSSDWNSEDSSQSEIFVDSSGNIHIVWCDYTNLEGCGTDQDIFYTKYSSNTKLWSLPTVISDNETNWNTGNSYSPSIAVDTSGNVHIVWNDNTNLNGCGTDSDIFYVNYTAATEKWSSPTVISDNETNWNTGNSYNPSIAVDTSGNVHVVWDDETDLSGCGTDSDIFYINYTAITEQWSTPSVISDNETNWNTGDSHNPSIAVDTTGNFHVVWEDVTDLNGCGTDQDIFYVKYFSTTEQWSLPTVISDNTNGTSNWNTGWSSSPSIAVDTSGNAHVMWEDGTNLNGCGNDDDIFYVKYSTMTQWSQPIVISDDASNWNTENSLDPSIVIDSTNNIYSVWYDYTNLDGCESDSDIFFRSYSPKTGEWSQLIVISDNMNGSINWNDASSEVPCIALDTKGNVHIVWEDETNLNGCGTDKDIFYMKGTFSTIHIETPPFIPGFSLNVVIPLIGITLTVLIYKYKKRI